MFFLKELPSQAMLKSYHQKFPDMNVDSVQSALKLMHRASFLIRELDTFFASHNLSQLRFIIFMVIDREQDSKGLTPGEITDKIGVSKPVMTRALKSLVRDDYARFERHEADRRAKRVILTNTGINKLNTILPGYYALLDDFMTRGDNYDD